LYRVSGIFQLGVILYQPPSGQANEENSFSN
jgi:hypothetical protein